MADEKRKHREVGPTVMEWSRYLVLDKCLRDQHRYYHLEDLVTAVNKMLKRYDFYEVSQRTVQQDLKFMQSGEGFGVELAKRYDEDIHLRESALHDYETADDGQGE